VRRRQVVKLRGRGAGLSNIAMIRPGAPTSAMRSDKNTASLIEWVMKKTVLPLSIQMRCNSLAICSRVIASSARTLVHDQKLRIVHQRADDRGAMLPAPDSS